MHPLGRIAAETPLVLVKIFLLGAVFTRKIFHIE